MTKKTPLEEIETELKRTMALSNDYSNKGSHQQAHCVEHYCDGLRWAISKIRKDATDETSSTV